MQIGDLVKWYVYYACGTIVKDAGLGLIIAKNSTSYGPDYEIFDVFSNELIRVPDGYVVKYGSSVAQFETYQIDLI